MARAPKAAGKPRHVVTLKHDKASRKNIPPAELQSTAELLEAEISTAGGALPAHTPAP